MVTDKFSKVEHSKSTVHTEDDLLILAAQKDPKDFQILYEKPVVHLGNDCF